MTGPTVNKCFTAMMLHDLCKAALDENGKWTGAHKKAAPEKGIAFRGGPIDSAYLKNLLGPTVYAEIKQHASVIKPASPKEHLEHRAIVISDRVQKAMYQMRYDNGDVVDESHLPAAFRKHLFPHPPFYPYYGPVVPAWDANAAGNLLRESIATLDRQRGHLTMDVLLEAQRPFRRFPHTTYIPHLSLEIHHRFAATLFLLTYNRLRKLQAEGKPCTALGRLHFCVVTAIPDPLELFYRLRDVKAYRDAARELRQDLYAALFADDCRDIAGASAEHNPFEYYTGDGLVILYDDSQAIVDEIQKSANRRETLRSLAVEIVEYDVPLPWLPDDKLGTVKAPAHHPEIKRRVVLASGAQTFPAQTLSRCHRCNIPTEEPRPSGLCASCDDLMHRPGLLALDEVAKGDDGQPQRLAYVFVTLPDDLRSHAQSVGKRHIDQMLADRARRSPDPLWDTTPGLLPTELGLFEYLEAVLAAESFQRDVQERKADTVRVIAEFPCLTIYVMREDQFLDFFDLLNHTLADMQFEAGMRAILCGLKTPVWSLMDRFAEHAGPARALVDTAGGETVMFTDSEVQAIRDLARFPSKVVSRAQLQALIQMARRGSLEELKLEIDRRCNKRKIYKDFAQAMIGHLSALESTGEEMGDREKRALFIKNVADLGHFKAQ